MQFQSAYVIGTVSSIKAPGVEAGKRFTVLPADKGTSPQDLLFMEFREYVKRALIAKGFLWCESKDQADVLVLLAYTIEAPKEHSETKTRLVYGQTGVSSSYTMGSVSQWGSYSGSTTYFPSYGVVGAVPETKTYSTCTKYIRLAAFDCKAYMANGQETMLWWTEIISTGSSTDLRRIFPFMIAGSQELIAENTGQALGFAINETDARVDALRQDKAQP
jgi:hypothetical protein